MVLRDLKLEIQSEANMKRVKHESGIEKLLSRQLEGLHVEFYKITNLPVDLEIGYVQVYDIGNTNIAIKNRTMYS